MKSNKIYKALIGECERLEYEGKYKGNGHHLAQRLVKNVVIELLPTNQRKIYDAMSNHFKTAKELSEIVQMPTKYISSQISQIDCAVVVIDKNEKPYRYRRG